MKKLIGLFIVFGLAFAACETKQTAGRSSTDNQGGGDTDTSGACTTQGATKCQGDDVVTCQDGEWVVTEPCTGDTPFCDDQLGCVKCPPGDKYCDGNSVYSCNETGTSGEFVNECPDGDACIDGLCSNECAKAAADRSYMGCEFLAVTTSNAVLDATFNNDFAVIIGNPGTSANAQITVSRAGVVVATATVPTGSSQAIELPFVTELKDAWESVVVPDGAYEIESNIPVVAYQYSPLHFEVSGIYSYTNDASLLLPLHTLTGDYMALTWPTWGKGSWQTLPGIGTSGDWNSWHPGFVTVAATQDNTSVKITSSAFTAGGAITALAPGESATITLGRGDVLQIYSQIPPSGRPLLDYCSNNGWEQTNVGNCPTPAFAQECEAFCSVTDGDLTGTKIEASQPVAVFAGHMCTFMPYYEWACDHLEEMAFPTESWGTNLVMTAPMRPDGTEPAPALYRVLALNDESQVSFMPDVHDVITLGAGEFVQFETSQDFEVTSDKQIYVIQTLLGQNYQGGSDAGDPAMGTGVPVFQARSTYTFLTPDTYTYNYVNIVAPTGSTVNLDGNQVSGWESILGSQYSVARVLLQPGAHLIKSEGDVGFGITTYGYASYTSYLFPGGMNVEEFAPI